MNEKKSVRSCTETIDGIGGIKKILNDEILLTQIICNENKQILLVFSDIINHAIRLNELDKEDFGLLRSKNFITLIINKYYDNPELLLKTVKYIGFIDDADVQIAAYTSPIVVINYIATGIIDNDTINNLSIDCRLKIVEELIRMNYQEKAFELMQAINQVMFYERDYYETARKRIPRRW